MGSLRALLEFLLEVFPFLAMHRIDMLALARVRGQRGARPDNSSMSLGLEVEGQVGGVTAPQTGLGEAPLRPVSDSAPHVEPDRTTVHKRPRIPTRPRWLLKNQLARQKEVRRSDNRKKVRGRILRKARDKTRGQRLALKSV